MNTELAECPCCGPKGRPSMLHRHDEDGCYWSYIECSTCGLRTRGQWVSSRSETCPLHYESVREEWNRRTAQPVSAGLTEDDLMKLWQQCGSTEGVPTWGHVFEFSCALLSAAQRDSQPVAVNSGRLYALLKDLDERAAEQPDRIAVKRMLVELRHEIGGVMQSLLLTRAAQRDSQPGTSADARDAVRLAWLLTNLAQFHSILFDGATPLMYRGRHLKQPHELREAIDAAIAASREALDDRT